MEHFTREGKQRLGSHPGESCESVQGPRETWKEHSLVLFPEVKLQAEHSAPDNEVELCLSADSGGSLAICCWLGRQRVLRRG